MSDLFDLSGQRALVTGASGGLGAHFAKVLAGAGAEVILAARRVDRLTALATELGGNASVIELDVADSASIEAAIGKLDRLDILFNNAGIATTAALADQSEADWDTVMDVNLKGAFLMVKAVAPLMRDRGGSVVNIASILGLRQGRGLAPYAVSKAGMIQLTKICALEMARHQIRVNAIAPGYIETDMNAGFWETAAGHDMIARIPSRRIGRPEDLDGPLLLLASDASRHMTGSVIAVDGGHLLSAL